MKVVVFFATGFEEIEALTVVDVLRRGGVEVIMAGIEGDIIKSGRAVSVVMDQKIEDINFDEVDMLFVPGGIPGVHNIYESEIAKEQLRTFKANDKWIGAICAGPIVLGRLGLLDGEKAICYPGFENELLGAEVIDERVVVSGKIITGIGAGASFETALALLTALKGQITSDKVKESMLIQI